MTVTRTAFWTGRRLWRDRGGASAIEFAIVAPFFLTLVFAIIIYGSYFASLSVVNHIAGEAARATLSGLSDGERSMLALARANELISGYSGLLNTDTIEVDAAPGSDGLYSVTVTNQFNSFGLANFSAFLPLPPTTQTTTVEVSHGGY